MESRSFWKDKQGQRSRTRRAATISNRESDCEVRWSESVNGECRDNRAIAGERDLRLTTAAKVAEALGLTLVPRG